MSDTEYGPEDSKAPPSYVPKFTFESGHFYQDGIEIPRWALTDAEMTKHFPLVRRREVCNSTAGPCFICQWTVNPKDPANWKSHMEAAHREFVEATKGEWKNITFYADAWKYFDAGGVLDRRPKDAAANR